MEIPPAGAPPLTAGIEPFTARVHPFRRIAEVDGETCLLIGKAIDRDYAVASIREGGCPAFRTSLGSADDLRQRRFVRLLRNVLDWIGE
jgi:hypothetical protein